MSVFRVEKTKGYTVMSNHHLRNHALSLKAKGLLSQMLSLPEDWDYTLQGLAQINKESIDAMLYLGGVRKMTKETFINTMELLKRQQDLNCGLAQELQITLRRAFPDVYDWILWWLAKPDNFAIWTDDEPQRWNLGDAGSLYNFISGAAVRDPALRGNDMSMLFLAVSQELYEQLKEHALETGLNLQELMLIILKWLLKHPGKIRRIIHTDIGDV